METDGMRRAGEVTRRQVMLAAAALAGPVALANANAAVPLTSRLTIGPIVLTSWASQGHFYAGTWSPKRVGPAIRLPARAHQILRIPAPNGGVGLQALVLSRRPGEFLLRMDVDRGRALRTHTMEEDRYLNGHAALSSNGKTFFTTETHGETGQGLIAERDLSTLSKLREFASGGIGPHALMVEPAGTLLVANGGILNLPETGRRKLNLGTMAPNLTRLEPCTGQIIAQYRLADPFLSLRHLTSLGDGKVAVALQAEHADMQLRGVAPALAVLRGEQLDVVPWDEKTGPPAGWDGYAGDIAFAAGNLWVSAPHAGVLASWSTNAMRPTADALQGVAALAGSERYCIAGGDSTARLYTGASTSARTYHLQPAWDNHAELLTFL